VAIAAFCADWLTSRGFDVRILERVPGRPTVVGTAHGTGGGVSLMLNGHLDTVGVVSASAFEPIVHEGRLIGRGAFDTKGGIAALLIAAAAAASRPHAGDIIVALVADEEFGSLGTEELLANVRSDAAIVVEPSELKLTLSHRGFAWFEIAIEGVAAHGSMPEQGVDAIAHASRILHALEEYRIHLSGMPGHPLLGHGTVRVATIAGGADAATVAAACTLTVERRFLPEESPDRIESDLRRALTGLLDERAPGAAHATLRRLVARSAFEADPRSAIVVAVSAAVERERGEPAVVRGEPFWTDAGLFAEAGIPCLVIGVDGGGAHADEEWATVESIRQLAAILESAISDVCR
jgi:acetylornithine deacetylase